MVLTMPRANMIQFFQGLCLCLSLIVFYALYRGIYNRYFHPLRNFPGPFWGSISDFYKLWILHTKQAHTLGLKYHERYGPVVRAAPNLLAVNDPLLLPQIYHRRVDKTDVYTTGVLGELAPPFQTIKHEDHAAKRKRVANSVGTTNLHPTTDACSFAPRYLRQHQRLKSSSLHLQISSPLRDKSMLELSNGRLY